MPSAVVLAAGLAGALWGLAADRIAARWPAHEDGSVRATGWRSVVAVVVGAVVLAAVPARFADPAAAALFGAYAAVLVLLLATDLDQRLLPDVLTLPAIPLALGVALLGLNPLVPSAALPVALAAAVAVPGLLALIAIPFGAGAIGMGDLKLLVSVALAGGAWRLLLGVIEGSLLAGVVIMVLLAARRVTLRSYIPFGPFLILGACWALFGPS